MTLLRTELGNCLRSHRLRQRRTLRDVSGVARVSLGYLSEVERGQKEASSELLASICDALELELADLLVEVSVGMRSATAPATEVPATEVPGTEVPGTEVPGTEVPGTPVPAASAPAVTSGAEPALALVGATPGRSVSRRGAVSLAA
jgi:transcriptional regulator with XRE-family HTH domain